MRRVLTLPPGPLALLLSLALSSLLVAGCSDDELSPPEAEAAREALGVMLAVEQSHQSEGLLGFVQAPLSAVTGNYSSLKSLGDFGLSSESLEDAWSLGKQLKGSLAHWRHSTRIFADEEGFFGDAPRRFAQRKEPECETTVVTGGTLEVCVDSLDGNIVEIVVTQTNDVPDEDGIVQVRWTLTVDTAGTVAEDDDLIVAMDSEILFDDGSEVLGSVRPVEDPAIGDNTLVTLSEIVRPATGAVVQQNNVLTMDLGLIETDGDEIIWELSSVLDFRNGASNSIAVTELNIPDGIRDDDQLAIDAEFVAPPSDPNIESASATIWFDVVSLEDESDDLLGRVSQTLVLDGNTDDGGIPTVFDVYEPDNWVAQGEEPTGGTFTRNATFPAGSDATLLTLSVDYDQSTGGSLDLDVEFADGTSYSLDISWDGAGTSTIAAVNRDGSTLDGSFNETTNSFTITTTYPAGHELSHVVQSGSSDGVVHDYTVVATYSDQRTETLTVESTESDGIRTVMATAETFEGVSTFTTAQNLLTGVITGSATGPDGESLEYSLTPLGDGRRLLEFSGEDVENDVTVSGAVVLNVDGSGCGSVRVSSDGASRTYRLCFDGDGTGTIDGEVSI